MHRVYTITVVIQCKLTFVKTSLLQLSIVINDSSILVSANAKKRRSGVRAPPGDFFLASNSLDLVNFWSELRWEIKILKKIPALFKISRRKFWPKNRLDMKYFRSGWLGSGTGEVTRLNKKIVKRLYFSEKNISQFVLVLMIKKVEPSIYFLVKMFDKKSDNLLNLISELQLCLSFLGLLHPQS